MTSPKPCIYERNLGRRVTIGEHRDDCPDPTTHRGCEPCTAGHCAICSRAHTSNQHPLTCPECVGSVRDDLTDIRDLCRQLRRQAVDAEGLAWANARIPGHDAMIAIGPWTDPEDLLWRADIDDYHHRGDILPPLTMLARWEERWSGWLDHKRQDVRASITRATGYFDRHLTLLAQQLPSFRDGLLVAPPEFPEFARDVADLRAGLERMLHDEAGDDHGVECFECGARLVRRVRDPKRCQHLTPARAALRDHLLARPDAQVQVAVLRSYEIPATTAEQRAARGPSAELVAAARQPCEKCGPDQGGVADPRPGISWECPSCRKRYTPGEYATAVRRDLADREAIEDVNGMQLASIQSYGWTDIVLAADAATTLVGYAVYATTVRKWLDRGDVAGCCEWSYDELDNGMIVGHRWGKRLVYWPDVADRAVAAQERARVAAIERQAKAVRDAARAVLRSVPRRLSKKRVNELMGMLPVTEQGELDEEQLRVLALTPRPRKVKAGEVSVETERIGA